MAKILLMDDDPGIIKNLGIFLSERGFQIVSASDGEEGLSVFDKEKPDLVICDLKMPKKDGFQFLKDIRAQRAWVPAIIISGLNETADIMKAYKHEADYYLTKPLDLEELLKGVKIMLALAPQRKK